MPIAISSYVVLFISYFFLSTHCIAASDIEAAYIAYEKRDYASALRILMPLADSGHSVAQFNVGNFYRNGWGVTQNYSDAFKWYRRSALMGYPPAQNSLGTMYRNGIGVTVNYAEAYKWYQESANAGNITAKVNLARMIQIGLGTLANVDHAVQLYEQVLQQKLLSIEDQEAKKDALEQLSILKKIPIEEIRKSLPKSALELTNENSKKDKIIIVEKEKIVTVNAPPIITAPKIIEPSIVFKTMNVHVLVIGNADYQGIGKLKNPVNDAKLIASKLREFNFKVTEVTNATRSSLTVALQKFSESAKDANLTIFYYAGHGVQIDGFNYILPVDTDMGTNGPISLYGVRINELIDHYLPGETRLIFLDACRDNPFTRSGKRGISRGLASIESAQGTLIAFAAKDGHVAYDGNKSNNSPFTKALVERIGDPNDISIILRKVRSQVLEVTKGQQEPWDYGSLTGDELILSKIKQPVH